MRLQPLFWPLWLFGAALFAAMAGLAAATSRFPGDFAVAERIQGIEGFGPIATFANAAGDLPFVLAATGIAMAYLLATARFAEAAIVVLSFAPRAIRDLMSELVARPRPAPDLLEVRDDASGFGFPSGHATGAVLLYGLLLYLVQVTVPRRDIRVLLQLAFAFIIVATAPARVYAGVHWPSDTLGGYLYGVLGLALLILAHRWLKGRATA